MGSKATGRLVLFKGNDGEEFYEKVHSTEVDVRPLSFTDIVHARNTYKLAFRNDPLFAYLGNTPDAPPSGVTKWKLKVNDYLMLEENIWTGHALAVGGGDACVTFNVSGPSGFIHRILTTLGELHFKLMSSPEQRKRMSDFAGKVKAAFKSAYGEKEEDMFYILALATSPQHQGRGYATALVRSVTAMADAELRDTWLVSSNVVNTAFYESCGFVTVREFLLGDDSSTWTKPPVIIRLMGRAPHNDHADSGN